MRDKYRWLNHLVLILVACTTIGPFLWMILTSLKTYEESIRIPPTIFPQVLQLKNYSSVWERFPVLSFYLNTIIVMVFTLAGQIIVCSLAAYAFARLRFAGRNVLFVLCLSMMMIPGQIFTIPHYNIIVSWHMNNTITALWLPRIFNILTLFMLRQFFMTLPKELDEAAKIDGCSYFQIYFQILMPLMKAPIVSVCILRGIAVWKDLMWPLVINVDMKKMTLTAGLANLIGQNDTQYPELMAGGVMAAMPMILIFIIFQKNFVEGIALSGTKA
ncbi:MAG: carbohydrate ABC transporter permease [Roseburia sp.]|jgi:multiple sugar transport system permease protein|nr:carbohydrate ABC transporter permease [Roseburia sp.]